MSIRYNLSKTKTFTFPWKNEFGFGRLKWRTEQKGKNIELHKQTSFWDCFFADFHPVYIFITVSLYTVVYACCFILLMRLLYNYIGLFLYAIVKFSICCVVVWSTIRVINLHLRVELFESNLMEFFLFSILCLNFELTIQWTDSFEMRSISWTEQYLPFARNSMRIVEWKSENPQRLEIRLTLRYGYVIIQRVAEMRHE